MLNTPKYSLKGDYFNKQSKVTTSFNYNAVDLVKIKTLQSTNVA